MPILIAILIGLAFGALFAFGNHLISRTCLKSGRAGFVSAAPGLHMLVYALCFLAEYLLSKCIPMEFSYALIASAIVLSFAGIVSTFTLARPKD